MNFDAGRRRILVVGVSRFAVPDTHSLPFAAADAVAFAAVFGPPEAVRTLIDGDATSAALQNALHWVASTEENDDVILFAVSRATRGDGEIRLATHDGDLAFDASLSAVWNGPARRVAILLDLHRGGEGSNESEVLDRLIALCPERPGRALLLADDGTHGSHVSGELQAGIWARHVTNAFAGAARNVDGTLTVGSLRTFLADELPRSLARAYTSGRRQNPVFITAEDHELLDEPVRRTQPPSVPHGSPAESLAFASEVELPVKSLAGFRKSLHRPPADTLASSREWVARLAEPDLAREIEATLPRLRQHLGYKRKDVRADGPAGGAASVLTPDFTYHLSAQQHDSRPDRAILRRRLTEFRNIDLVGREDLSLAFPHGFSSLYQPFEIPADVPSLIDALEDMASRSVSQIVYPADATFCELELNGFDGRVRVDRDGLTVTAAGSVAPAVLATQFALVKRILQTADAEAGE